MGTNYGSTKDAFRAMHSKYTKYRKKMVEQWTEIEALKAKKKEIISDVRLTSAAKMNEITEIGNRIFEVNRRLEETRREALRDLGECVRDAESSVGRRFRPDPATVRRDVIELVDSGALSFDELLTLCEDNNINDLATKCILGRKFIDMAQDDNAHLNEEQRQQLESMGYNMQSRDNRFSDHLEALKHVFDAALRTERDLADGIAENIVDDAMNEAWGYADAQMKAEYGVTAAQAEDEPQEMPLLPC